MLDKQIFNEKFVQDDVPIPVTITAYTDKSYDYVSLFKLYLVFAAWKKTHNMTQRHPNTSCNCHKLLETSIASFTGHEDAADILLCQKGAEH